MHDYHLVDYRSNSYTEAQLVVKILF